MSVPVKLTGCGKTFAGARVLEPLDLQIAAGETMVLLGPSGCGKTTLLRLVAGLESPDPGGQVFFGEREVTHLPVEERNAGMVFQSYALFPNMTVAENVAYGLKVQRRPRAERQARVAEMLAMMRIADLANRPVDKLSGGQRQRVALARAIAVSPSVLLLDEPLTALDAKLREALRGEIDALLRSLGITAIYVTHDQAEAMALGDRIVVMSKGRVAQIGTPREIWFSPADRYVAEFIGAANRLNGRVEAGRLLLAGTGVPWDGPPGPVDVIVRPDALTISGAEDGISGRVEAVQFLGGKTRVTVSLNGTGQVTADIGGREAPRPGSTVRLAVDRAALIVFPQGEPS